MKVKLRSDCLDSGRSKRSVTSKEASGLSLKPRVAFHYRSVLKMPEEWRYYDFDSDWDAFYQVWTSDVVQDVLKKDMESWIQNEAYLNSPPWKPKADLWEWSRTDYHHQKVFDKASDCVKQHGLIKQFGEALERAGTPVNDEEALKEKFYDVAFEEVLNECTPVSGSLEAQVLVFGARYLNDAIIMAGKQLFPNSEVFLWVSEDEETDMVVVHDKHLMLNFNYYYWWKHEGEDNMSPHNVHKALIASSW